MILFLLATLIYFINSYPEIPTRLCIQKIFFPTTYSCGGGSYNTSALFLSFIDVERNEPSILFEGAKGGSVSFLTYENIIFFFFNYGIRQTAGSDYGFIANIGEKDLKDLTVGEALGNYQWKGKNMDIKEGESYAVNYMRISDEEYSKAFLLFHINEMKLNEKGCYYAKFEYAVMQYDRVSDRYSEWLSTKGFSLSDNPKYC